MGMSDLKNVKAMLYKWNRPSTYIIIVIAFAYFWPSVHDSYFRPEPWVQPAVLEIVEPGNGGGPPLIHYQTTSSFYVFANWAAWVLVDNQRSCVSHGTAAYGDTTEDLYWTWDSFFERPCPVPSVPFSICVRYDAETPNGIRRESGPFCSEKYDP